MTFARYLSVGDGATSDSLDFNDAVNYAHVATDLGYPDEITNRRTIVVTLNIIGTDGPTMWANVQALQKKARQAQQGTVGDYTVPMTLGAQLNSSALVYFDVFDLTVTIPPASLYGAIAYNMEGVTLTLTTSAYGRGETLTAVNALDSPSSGPVLHTGASATITNGSDSTVYVMGYPRRLSRRWSE